VDGLHAASEVTRTFILQIVARHRRKHNMVKMQSVDRLGHTTGLVRSRRLGSGRRNRAKMAPASTLITQDHERRVPL
jgi:hypothetical protein